MKYYLLLLLVLTSCQKPKTDSHLISLQMIDRNGQTETISQESRIKVLEKQDFNKPQAYDKILRVFSKNEEGKNPSILTTYHKNGQLFQRLEALDGRAFGQYEEFYENGIKRIQAKVIEGTADLNNLAQASWVFDGLCQIYYQNGSIQAEFTYDRGKRTHQGTYYFENGNVSKTIHFEDDLAHGVVKEFYPGGELMMSYEFHKGKQHGISQKYTIDQKIIFEETWAEDKLLEGSYFDSSMQLVSKIESGNGTKTIYENEKIVLQMEYHLGKIHGKISHFTTQGLVDHIYHLEGDKKQGEEILFHENSSHPKLRIEWVDDAISGLVKSYYKDGSLESQKCYSLNKKNGPSSIFYPSGDLMMLETYSQDKLIEGKYYKKGEKTPFSLIEDGTGKATFFDEWGGITQEIEYEKSKIVMNDD